MRNKLFLFLFLGLFLISFASADLTDNLISYYKLDETSGTVLDSHGSNDGTNYGATPNVAGKIDTAYDFENSENDYISLPQGIATSLSSTALTINMWIYPETNFISTTGIRTFFDINGNSRLQIDYNGYAAGDLRLFYSGANARYTTTFTADTGYMLTFTGDALNNKIYINGNLVATQSNGGVVALGTATTILGENYVISPGRGMDGKIDEVGIWSRALTSDEVSELYNSGDGLAYPLVINTPKVTLESPINGTTISDIGYNFTVSGSNMSFMNASWNNVTFIIWENSSVFNQTTVSFSDREIFNETLFIDSFEFKNYEWTANACYTNITDSYCISAGENYTLSVSLFTIINQTYTNETIGGTLENFSVTLMILPGYDLLNAKFIYNGTDTSPRIYSEGDNRYLLVSDYEIPIITSDTNITFNWDLTFTGSILLSTDNINQLIRSVMLDDCSIYTNKLFNLTLRDEQSLSLLNGNIEVIYKLLNKPAYSTINTYSFNVINKNNVEVCSGLNLTSEDLAYSVEIRYLANGYEPEFYNIQRGNIGVTTQNINLYDLNSSSSTEFKVTYQDSSFNFVDDAIVQLQRKYISEDIYEVVESPLTSSDGVVLLHIDMNSVKYRATVTKNGVLLDEFDNLVFKCQSELTGECEFKLLGNINPQNDLNYENTIDFYYSEPVLTNESITITFSIPSGTPALINLVMTQTDQFANKTLCNKTITSSSGSITCDYSASLGESYIDLYLYKDGEAIIRTTYILYPESELTWLGNNYIFIIILLFSLVGMALSSPEWIIINGIITIVISGGLWLANGLSFVMGLGNIIWLVIAGIILISKISQQEDR